MYNILEENCNSLTAWTVTIEGGGLNSLTVDPSGEFFFYNVNPGFNARITAEQTLISPPDKFILQMTAFFDSLNSIGVKGDCKIFYSSTTWELNIRFGSDGLFIKKAGGVEVEVGTDIVLHDASAAWQTFRFVVDKTTESAATVEVFLGSVSQGVFDCNNAGAGYDGQFRIETLANPYSGYNQFHIDQILAWSRGLTVTKPGTGTGTVTSVPAGISCGTTCTCPFDTYPSVVLSAVPSVDSFFAGWTGDGTGDVDRTVVISTYMVVNAIFNIKEFLITAFTNNVYGTITASQRVNYGSDATFSITPNVGFTVLDVLVDGVSVGAVESYVFTNVTNNHTIEAIFSGRQFMFKTKRYKYAKASLKCIKVLAISYPVTLDVVYPDIPFTDTLIITSSKPQRIKNMGLTESCEVTIYGDKKVSAVYLASMFEELPV